MVRMINPSTPEGNLPRQGDTQLLKSPIAQLLLSNSLLARLAYNGKDGAPRLIPVNFLWTGEELVIGAFAHTYKVRDLRAHPAVAICIDTADGPPKALMLRGEVALTDVDGVLPEYATMQLAVMGEEMGSA